MLTLNYGLCCEAGGAQVSSKKLWGLSSPHHPSLYPSSKSDKNHLFTEWRFSSHKPSVLLITFLYASSSSADMICNTSMIPLIPQFLTEISVSFLNCLVNAMTESELPEKLSCPNRNTVKKKKKKRIGMNIDSIDGSCSTLTLLDYGFSGRIKEDARWAGTWGERGWQSRLRQRLIERRCGGDSQWEIVLRTKACHLYGNPGLWGKPLLSWSIVAQRRLCYISFHL